MFDELDKEGRVKLQAQLDKLDCDAKLRAKLDPIAPRFPRETIQQGTTNLREKAQE
jgi:hypothetical protein